MGSADRVDLSFESCFPITKPRDLILQSENDQTKINASGKASVEEVLEEPEKVRIHGVGLD